MDGGDVAVFAPNKNEMAAVVTDLTPNADISYESKRQSSEISDPISVDLDHADSQEDLTMATSPITEPVRASPPLPSLRSRVASESVYLLDHNMAPHYPLLMNHYHPMSVLVPSMGPVQTEAIPTDGHGINDINSVNNRNGTSPTNNLTAMIQHQIEYYFSRDNLQNDSYLLSQMDEDQFVAVQTIAGFNQIKKMTTDMKLVVEAIKNSPYLQIDDTGTKVRANLIRSVIILREIPESTSIEDVKNLFDSKNCPKFVTCEFAHNNSWYVSFDTEVDAREAYRYLREEVKEFLGKPIYARIKGKTLQRNSYNKGSKLSTPAHTQAQQPQPQQQSMFPFAPPLQPPIMLYPTIPPWPPQAQPFFEHPNVSYMVNGYPPGPGGYHHHHHHHHHHHPAGHLANFNRHISNNHRNRGGGSRSYSQGDQPTAPVMQQQHNNSSSSYSTQSLPPRYNRARDNSDDGGRKGSRMRNARRKEDYADKPPRQQKKVDLEPSQFPPLVTQPTTNGSHSSQQGNGSEDGYAQAASVKGKKPNGTITADATLSTAAMAAVTATTPVSSDKLISTAGKPASAEVTIATAQLPASSNSLAEVKSAPVPTPPPATPPKSTQKVIPTSAAKIVKQEPSKPGAAKPSRVDKDSSSSNRSGTKAKSSDNTKPSHQSSKSSRRDKKKLESRSSQQQQQPAKGSVQIDKKQQIPLPPSPPASNTADKDDNKPEKLSYALVAQKAKGKPDETSSQPGSPPGEMTSDTPTTSQPCSPDKCKDIANL